MLHFDGYGQKYNNIRSRDDIIKSGYKHNADIFKINKILNSFQTDELNTQEALEYIIKDSIDCITFESREPELSDFGLKQTDIDNLTNIRYISLFNIISVIICALLFSLITSIDTKSTVLIFLVLYGITWGIYFNSNNMYTLNIKKINMYNSVIVLYQKAYNNLIEKEKKRQELKRRKILGYWENILNNTALSTIEKGRIFEIEMTELFKRLGWKVQLTPTSRDGGADIILDLNGERCLVQCKFYRKPLGPEPVRALWGVKDSFNANKVMMLAYAGVTQGGEDFAAEKNQGRSYENWLYKIYDINDIINMYDMAEKMNT